MTEFMVSITYDNKTEDFSIGEWEEFPEAAKQAELFLEEQGIKDYSINLLKAVSGEYEGRMIKGENINTLFITKEEILEALQDETIGIGFQDDSVTAYMADNYFYFDCDFIDELPESYCLTDEEIADAYLRKYPSYTIAEKIHECLEEFITEFPMEYWSYKLCLTKDNKDKTIKIESFDKFRNDFER